MSQPYSGDNLGESATGILDPLNRRGSRGACDFSVRHNFNGSAIYDFPSMHNIFLSGFQIAITATVHSGLPFTPLEPGTRANTTPSGGTNTPDVVYGVSPDLGRHLTAAGLTWFNPAAFAPSAVGVLGNAARDSLIGPGLVNFDCSLIKNTPIRPISETANLQLRWEVFNALNHPNFGMPNATVFGGSAVAPVLNPTAGVITTTSGFMRQMQFGVRLVF